MSYKSITKKSCEAIIDELREDIYLSRLAEKAEIRAKGKARVPAEKVWKELDLSIKNQPSSA